MSLLPPARVELPAELQQDLLRAARAALPREFVAALGGHRGADGWRLEAMLPLPNVAIAADRFEVPPAAFAAAEAELRRRQLTWLGFVHSHPDGSATPSGVDHAQLWWHCLQCIVSVPRGVGGRLLCHWRDAAGFHALPLVQPSAVAP
ncbi:MAG: Mov34/MPN/PAD-1 family protein [Planctomycetes bacterium]|jgi:proteasome lid subunit RPN8/RPN11|nr:Mov34/MPN/PAD-1 family protein [Planctomycetota bacterium]